MKQLEDRLEGIEPGEQLSYADEVVTNKGRSFAAALSDRALYFPTRSIVELVLRRRLGDAPLRRLPLEQVSRIRTMKLNPDYLVASAAAVLGAAVILALLKALIFTILAVPLLGLPLVILAYEEGLEVQLSSGARLRWSPPDGKTSDELRHEYDRVRRELLAACRSAGLAVGEEDATSQRPRGREYDAGGPSPSPGGA